MKTTFEEIIKKYLENLKNKKKPKAYLSGYDYAIYSLTKGVSIEELKTEISIFDFNEFNKGILKGIKDFGNPTAMRPAKDIK